MPTSKPIEQAFRTAARAGRKVLIPYVMAGDPDLSVTRRLVPALAAAGADVVELGIPFSDPIADGPVILRAAMRALVNDTSLAEVIGAVRDIRRDTDVPRASQVPIVFMSYYNPILQMGPEKFAAEAVAAGVSGVIVPDLPPEEGTDLVRAARKAGLATIFLLAPTSDPGRIARIARVSTGFLYYVSLTGITGSRLTDPDDVARRIADIRKVTDKPIAVGFGIATPEQAHLVGRMADGVIVGSALVKVIEREVEAGSDPEKLIAAAGAFVAGLRRGLDG
jgi:tryptophan synthase alpha chain